MISHTDGNGHVDTKNYDLSDNTIDEIAANGAGSNRTFVDGSLNSNESNPDYDTKSYTYDLGNNLTVARHGNRICYYDGLDQLSRERDQHCMGTNNNIPTLEVADNLYYDQSAFGNLDSVQSGVVNPTTGKALGENTYYSYDTLGRIIRKSGRNLTIGDWGATPVTYTNHYSYSLANRPTSITYPSGNQLNYLYNTYGMLQAIKLNGKTLIESINYDGAHRLRGWSWGSGGTFNIDIPDLSGFISGIRNHDGNNYNDLSISYVPDEDGRIIKQTVNGVTTTYTYDYNSQLLKEVLPTGSLSYTYDSNGNRTSLSTTDNPGIGISSATYNYTANHLSSYKKDDDHQPFGYFDTKELVLYALGGSNYDYKGRKSFEFKHGFSIKNDYNHKNERTMRGGSQPIRQFAYDEQSHLIGEYDIFGNILIEYVWMEDRPIAAILPNNRIINLITDHQNKPRRGLDAQSHQVVWTWDPDAFGMIKPTGSITMNLRFAGQQYDEESGLFYNHNRYYNPELGRYMEPDPIGLEGGLNPYAYAGNNPVMNVDPTGLFTYNSLNLDWSPSFDNFLNSTTSNFSNINTMFPAALGAGALWEAGGAFLSAAVNTVGALIVSNSFSQSKDYVTPSGVKLEVNNPQIDRFIFRGGNGNGVNLTPRPTDTNGMSYYLKPPVDKKYTFTTLSAVNSTGVLRAVVDAPGHASVFPTNRAMMPNWINSRPTANENPHPYTLIMQGISIRMKKGELP